MDYRAIVKEMVDKKMVLENVGVLEYNGYNYEVIIEVRKCSSV